MYRIMILDSGDIIQLIHIQRLFTKIYSEDLIIRKTQWYIQFCDNQKDLKITEADKDRFVSMMLDNTLMQRYPEFYKTDKEKGDEDENSN